MILGLSHLICESNEISESIEFYKKRDFSIILDKTIEIPELKKQILKNQKVKNHRVVLLRKKNIQDGINIELVSHMPKEKIETVKKYDNLTLGLNNENEYYFTEYDNDDNKIYNFKSKTATNVSDIIYYTENPEATEDFFSKFNLLKNKSEIINIFHDKYIATFEPKNCIISSWKASIHLIKSEKKENARNYIDEPGFSTIAFYGKNIRDITSSGLDFIGPIVFEKGILNERKLTLFFIKTPDDLFFEIIYL